jgi:hypothetical protein
MTGKTLAEVFAAEEKRKPARYIVKLWDAEDGSRPRHGVWDTKSHEFVDVWRYKADASAHCKRLNSEVH